MGAHGEFQLHLVIYQHLCCLSLSLLHELLNSLNCLILKDVVVDTSVLNLDISRNFVGPSVIYPSTPSVKKFSHQIIKAKVRLIFRCTSISGIYSGGWVGR